MRSGRRKSAPPTEHDWSAYIRELERQQRESGADHRDLLEVAYRYANQRTLDRLRRLGHGG